jgi:hypothetical protein
MPDYRSKLPKILWGAGFVNTLNVGYPLDNWATFADPREGFQTTRAPSGVEDAWDVQDDYYLAADLRWIPAANTAAPLATGWDGVTGVRAFLAWARRKNLVRFYPDATSGTFIDSYLVDPMSGEPPLEDDGTRRIRLVLRSATTAFEGY